jgi:hypothetical protein
LAHDHVLDSWELLKAVLAEAPGYAETLSTAADSS